MPLRRLAAFLTCLAIGGFSVTTGLAADAERALARATFAGGCFWCMEAPFDALEGVVSTTAGFTGGDEPNPTYEAVASGQTGHAEAVEVLYDPARVNYRSLLEVFWLNIDPLDGRGQFCDRGRQYRAAIFVHDASQRAAAEAMQRELGTLFDARIATAIVPAGPFYPAGPEHQDYYREHRLKYLYYRYGCGRDTRLKALWGAAAGGPVKH